MQATSSVQKLLPLHANTTTSSLVRPKVLVLEMVKSGLWREMEAKRVAAVVALAHYLLFERVTFADSIRRHCATRDRDRGFEIANASAVCRPPYRAHNSLAPLE
jgi:hypothetical protein